MSYNSKYTGTQVEEFLDQIANGEIGGGGITTETDPIFSASPAASITDAKKAEWDGKQDAIADLDAIRSGAEKGATALQSVPSGYVTDAELSAVEAKIPNVTDALYPGSTDAIQSGVVLQTFADFSELFSQTLEQGLSGKVDKVNGKQLSTEDFTTILKTKLEGLNNYNDTELSNALSTLRGDFDKLVSGDTTTAIKTFNEVIAFLDGIQDSQDLSSIIASIEQQIAGKYTKPSGGIPASDLAPDVFLQGEKGDKGDKGDTGATGPQGPQGVSVTSVAQTTTSSADGGSNVVTVTLSDGKTSTFTVKNGSKGSQGEQGPKGDKGDKGDTGATGATGANGTNGKDGADGKDGATFTPSVDANGNLSWTNNKGLSNPPTVNIKGPKGDSGEGGGGSLSYPVADIYPYQVDEDGINPNIYYKVIGLAEGEIFYITLNEPTDNSIVNEYVMEFYIIPPNYVGEPAIVLPDTVVWANGKIPPMTGGKTYVVSIVNNFAVFAEF